jgi:hypothetical protein
MSMTLAEEVEVIVSSQSIMSPSAMSALMPLKTLDPSRLAQLTTTQSTTSNWPEQRLFMSSLYAPTISPLGRQLLPQAIKAFWPKAVKWRQLSLMRKYVLSTLRTFPHIMLSDWALPPFVHRLCMIEEKRDSHPGPLSRCAGIMALWSTKNENNKHYIWKIIRMEQERLAEEVILYSDWNAVAALQAITIYFLLRVSADNDEDANFDIPLIETMAKLSQRVKGITAKYCDPASTAHPTWEGWILVESLRRTISTLFIIEFLFDISPGLDHTDCNSSKHWAKLLLPSTKQLWAAQTRFQWEQEYRASNSDRRPTFQELLRHDDIESPSGPLLDQWMGQVDEFGTLVINAASLAEVVGL